MDFSHVHIRYLIGYVYHNCLQDTIQSTLSSCLLCQAMLLPMRLRPLLLTTRSGFIAVVVASFVCIECPVGGGGGYVGYVPKALEKQYLEHPGLHAVLPVCRFSYGTKTIWPKTAMFLV